MIYSLGEHHVKTSGDDYFVAPSASVIGRVTLGTDANIWFGAVVRGDGNTIRIGERTNVQDTAVIHIDDDAPVDIADGFIHFSTAAQARETAAKHFAGAHNLLLVALDADGLGDELKWEVSRGGDHFPHLYRPFALEEVLWAKPLPLRDGVHDFSGLLPGRPS